MKPDRPDGCDHDLVIAALERINGLDQKITALDRLATERRLGDLHALEVADAGRNEALHLARTDMEKRLEKLNEFRGALQDAHGLMMPRAEAKLLMDSLTQRQETLQRALNDLGSTFVGLQSSLQGQDAGIDLAQESADRGRALVFAILALIGTVIGATISLYLGLR